MESSGQASTSIELIVKVTGLDINIGRLSLHEFVGIAGEKKLRAIIQDRRQLTILVNGVCHRGGYVEGDNGKSNSRGSVDHFE